MGDKTHGRVFDANGLPVQQDPVVSGNDVSLLDDLRLTARERASVSLLSHVEAKVAAGVRRGALPPDTVLVLNHVPCPGRMGCRTYLPSILPAGARLAVYVSDGQRTRLFQVFHGTGSRITP